MCRQQVRTCSYDDKNHPDLSKFHVKGTVFDFRTASTNVDNENIIVSIYHKFKKEYQQ